MRLHPCPVCGYDPEVVRTLDEEGVGWVIQCPCTAAFGRTEEEAERLWNGLYCADDPATAADCMEGERCPGATVAGGAT